MNTLERTLIKTAKHALEEMRFVICDPKAKEAFAESAKELDWTIDYTLAAERTLRMTHVDALTSIADQIDSGLSADAEKELRAIALECRALERTALWTGS